MAAIAAHWIAAMKEFDVKRIKVVTFGEPRTGDIAFAEAHNKLVSYMEHKEYRAVFAEIKK